MKTKVRQTEIPRRQLLIRVGLVALMLTLLPELIRVVSDVMYSQLNIKSSDACDAFSTCSFFVMPVLFLLFLLIVMSVLLKLFFGYGWRWAIGLGALVVVCGFLVKIFGPLIMIVPNPYVSSFITWAIVIGLLIIVVPPTGSRR